MDRGTVSEIGTAILFAVATGLAALTAIIMVMVNTPTSASNPSGGIGYVLYFIVGIILMSALIIFLSRKRGLGILRYIFAISMAFVIFLVVNYLYALLPVTQLEYEILVFATPVVFLYFLLFRPNWIVVNIAGVLVSAGLASIWGLELGIYAAVVLMIVFAVYDYIAVYKTKHMLTIARASTDSRMPLFFIIPERRGVDINKINIDVPGDERGAILIGYGDIAIPNIMVISSYLYSGLSIEYLLFPLIGGIIALFVLFRTVKKPAPGLPFLNTGVLIGFGIALLLTYLRLI
ncbi:presenilin family intramembrane aspartyl protease PSH [Caldiplasma sukawensis]